MTFSAHVLFLFGILITIYVDNPGHCEFFSLRIRERRTIPKTTGLIGAAEGDDRPAAKNEYRRVIKH